MNALALAAIALLAGCPTPPDGCRDTWEDAQKVLRERWPTAGAALGSVARDDGGAVWYWAHKQASVEGFGVVLATVEHAPVAVRTLGGLPRDVHGGHALTEPSLLFFQQTEGPMDAWPLVGFGHHWDYVPCLRPRLDCVDPDTLFVHEAGYHRVLVGDGGMTRATEEDLVSTGAGLDPSGCSDVNDADLRRKVNTVRHGRAWVTHIWFPPPDDGGPPQLEMRDPWERWRDAPASVAPDEGLFFAPDPVTCGCAPDTGGWRPEAPSSGCNQAPGRR